MLVFPSFNINIQSLCLSVSISLFIFFNLSVYLFQSLCLSLFQSLCLSMSNFIRYQFTIRQICENFYQFVSIFLFTILSFILFFLSICLSITLYFILFFLSSILSFILFYSNHSIFLCFLSILINVLLCHKVHVESQP